MNLFKLTLGVVLVFCFTTTNAQVTVGPMVIGQGVTSPDDWVDYSNLGIYVDVNTSTCGFETTPHYMITLESITNLGYHWATTGVPAIYNPTPTGFRVYLRWAEHPTDDATIGSLNFGNPLRASTALDRGWVIRWTGIVTGDCGTCDSGSFVPIDNSAIDAEPATEVGIVSQPSVERAVNLFPNPGSTTLTISSPDKITESRVYDLNGRLIITTTEDVVDIKNLPNGNYSVMVFFGKEFVTKKFIKME